MRTTKVLLALAVVAMLTTGAMAQDAQKKKGRAKLNPVTQVMMRLEKLHESLKKMDLTEDQQKKLATIQTEVGPQMKTAMEKLVGVLGEEKMKAARETAKKAKEAGKTSRQVAVAVEAALKLDDEQKEKLAKIGKELTTVQRGMMKKINGILTPEQKKKLTTAMGRQGGKGKKKQDK